MNDMEDMQWNHTAQDKVNWDTPVNMTMNFKVSQIARNFITTYRTITESTAILLYTVNQSLRSSIVTTTFFLNS